MKVGLQIMKKMTLIPLTLIAGVLAIGYASSAKSNLKEAKAVDPVTYIEMNSSAFTNWTDDAGDFADKNATFWDENHHFNALDTFFRGETKGDWQGTLTLKTWTQYTQYIYFTWGGANNGLENKPTLEIHCGSYTFTMENDTFSGNPMLLRYFKIPDEQYALLDQENGFDMYINLIDQRPGADYGFHNFGYLHVNQTEEQVGDAMRYYLNHIQLVEVNDYNPRNIFGHYLANADLKKVFLKTASNIDENFDSKTNFLNHWYLDVNYDNFEVLDRYPDELLSIYEYRSGADYSTMPFNKTGSSFFRGYRENGQGYVASDNPIYRFKSRPFVLGGTGLVSIKMAGKSASLHVIDAETQEDLAWADLRTFNLNGDEKSQYLGFNTVTMVRHYINLSEYLGKTIQLALADVYSDQWASSYFDELITNYESYPSFDIDTTSQQCGEGLQDVAHMYYFDQYIASTHIDNDSNGLKYKLPKEDVTTVDETPIYNAYKFLKHYYSALRSPDNEFNYAKASEETKQQIVNEYLALDSDAQQIVNKSTDLQYNQEFSNEWYRKGVTASNEISTSFSALVDEYETFTVTFASNGGSGSMTNVAIKGEYSLPQCGFTAPEGKAFAGWKVGSDEEIKQPGDKIAVTADVTITAQWKIAVFTVTFNSNGGAGTMENVEVNEGEQLTLPTCTFIAPEGKEFDCWIIKNELYAAGDKVDIVSDTEVFAKWKKISVIEDSYTISFDSNGGTGEMADVTDVEGDYTLPSCTFIAPEGQEFDCWLIGSEQYQVGQIIDVNSDLTLVASWKDSETTPVDPVDPVDPIDPVDPEPEPQPEPEPEQPEKKGCGGSILSASILISSVSLLTVLLIVIKKNEEFKNN